MRILIALFAIVGILFVVGCECGSDEPDTPNEVSQLMNDIDTDFQSLQADIDSLQLDLDTGGFSVPIDAYKPIADNDTLNTEPRHLEYGCFGSV